MDRPKTKKQRKLARLADQAQDVTNKERLARPMGVPTDHLDVAAGLRGPDVTNGGRDLL